ncbi:MAG: RagB/SusD family nutrient uptake outer membrane protein, partial [Tannerellaceae bacterium]|nr:RagB/SusD family nutrient uptake outer membrane protein [Tannerellaceae bacterium]
MIDVKETLASLNEYGKINKATCQMILAKMYLNYNAWFETNDVVHYQKAYDQAEDIIHSGKYTLPPAYSDPFKADLSQCSEVIFALPGDNNYARANYCVNKCFHGAG